MRDRPPASANLSKADGLWELHLAITICVAQFKDFGRKLKREASRKRVMPLVTTYKQALTHGRHVHEALAGRGRVLADNLRAQTAAGVRRISVGANDGGLKAFRVSYSVVLIFHTDDLITSLKIRMLMFPKFNTQLTNLLPFVC